MPRSAGAGACVTAGARVAVLSDESGISGFFPHERHTLGIGRPIGAGLSGDKDTIVFGVDQRIYATVLHLDSLIRGAQTARGAASSKGL